MRLRTFEARTMAEALQHMRRELGEEAVLVASQPHGGGVKVTAAVGLAGEDLAQLLGAGRAPKLRTTLKTCLDHHGVVPALRDALLADGERVEASEPAPALATLLERRFRFAALVPAAAKPLALIGPPGSGKTASIVRLAVQAVLAGGSVQVLSTDGGRAGAAAQLGELLRPLGLTPAFAANVRELARHAAAVPPDTALLLDTTGINAFDGGEMARLVELVRAARAEPVLVLPAGMDAHDSVELAGNFAASGVRRMIATKLDVARRLGGLLAAADLGLAFAGASIGPAIGRGPHELTAIGLARLLLHRAGIAEGRGGT